MSIVKTHAARRTVVVSGSVEQMSKAFAVALGRYEHTVVRHKRARPQIEAYRGRDGFIHVPKDLAKMIVGVFGLDNRRVTQTNGNPADPPSIATTTLGSSGFLTVPAVAKAYNFPSPGSGIAGQTIGIVSAAAGLVATCLVIWRVFLLDQHVRPTKPHPDLGGWCGQWLV